MGQPAKPKSIFSIVTPVYNRAKLICEAMESVWVQSHRPIEFIVVDDGSSDDSVAVMKSWIASLAERPGYDPQDFKVVLLEKENGGPSSARNLALESMTGDFVIFLDSDDVLEQDALADLATAFEADQVDMIFAGFRRFDNETGDIVMTNIPDKAHGLVARTMEGCVWANACRFAMRTSFARTIGPWNESYPLFEDRDYGERAIMLSQHPEILPRSLIKVRTNADARQNDQLQTRRGRKYRILCEKNLIALARQRTDITEKSWSEFKSRIYGLSFRSYASGWREHGRASWELAESVEAPLDARGRRRRMAARFGWLGGTAYLSAGHLLKRLC